MLSASAMLQPWHWPLDDCVSPRDPGRTTNTPTITIVADTIDTTPPFPLPPTSLSPNRSIACTIDPFHTTGTDGIATIAIVRTTATISAITMYTVVTITDVLTTRVVPAKTIPTPTITAPVAPLPSVRVFEVTLVTSPTLATHDLAQVGAGPEAEPFIRLGRLPSRPRRMN